MTTPQAPSIRTALQSALRRAMKERDGAAMSTYRTAMAVIDNAEAVPLTGQDEASALEHSAVGVGGADTPRRALPESAVVALVRTEAEESRDAADSLDAADAETAARLRRSATLLDELLAAHAPIP